MVIFLDRAANFHVVGARVDGGGCVWKFTFPQEPALAQKKNTVLILHTVYTNYITNFLLFVPTYGNKILNVFRVVL